MQTGYPSIDRPWEKYFPEEIDDTSIDKKSLYSYAFENNADTLDLNIFDYFGKKISYGEFFKNVRRLAKSLTDKGISHGDIVTIVSMQTPETIELIYALNYIGAIANMAYMTLPTKEIEELVYNTNSKALFILDLASQKIENSDLIEKLPVYMFSLSDSMPLFLKLMIKAKKNSYPKLTPFSDLMKNKDEIEDSCNDCEEDVAVIVYTSGTTGQPKGVMLTNKNINALILQYYYTDIHFGKGETFLDILPPFLGYGIGMMAIAIYNGIRLDLWLKPEAKQISEQFYKKKPNHIELGKAHVMQIIDDYDGKTKLDFTVNFAGGGDGLAVEEERKINEFLKNSGAKGRFIYGYGMTECASCVCTNTNLVYKEGSVGVPLPLSAVKITDPDNGELLKYGQTGEICICAPNVMKGYYNNEAATNEVISYDEDGKRWIHSGDLGHVDEDGFIYITGRLKRIYLAKAEDEHIYKLFPQRIEELYKKENADVKKCGCIAVENDEGYYYPIAFILVNNADCDKDKVIYDLHELSTKELPEYSRPKKIICIDEMPYTSSGKIDYKQLEKILAE